MLAWTATQINGNHTTLPKTLVNITSTFCEGYGRGFIGKVLKSPHKHLVGKIVKVDMRNEYLNQYFNKIKQSSLKKNSFTLTL